MEAGDVNNQIEILRQIGDQCPDAVIIVTRDRGDVVYANRMASRLFEVNTGDDLRKISGLIESVISADRAYVRNKFQAIDKQPATLNVEFRMIGSDGDTKTLSCDAYLIANKQFLYVVARDITHWKRHEEYLVEYGSRKNTLLDTLVHQLSGSLMLVSNLALRAGKLKVTTDQRALEEFVTLVHNSAKHSIDIIEDLLKKEHTASPGIHVKFSRTNVVKIVGYVFEEMKKSNGVRELLMETSSTSIYVNTDEIKLLQVVNNFASNAMKFTRAGDKIRLSVRETSDSVVISVADTGIGIPQQLQPFLFEKHGPARRTGLNGEKSIGLGLSICRNLTNLMGGKIRFESTEGKGSTFSIELPKD